MWLDKIKSQFTKMLAENEENSNGDPCDEKLDMKNLDKDQEDINEKIKQFKLDNVVYNKLNYLKQYIKIFSLTFPKDYQEYLSAITHLKEAYDKELDEYKRGLEGNIIFSIDPENESKIYVQVVRLENKIKKFVDTEVSYKLYKDKFSKLCYKMNTFYNAFINTDIEENIIKKQLKNAFDVLQKNVDEVKTQEFFSSNSRKREEILHYILYSEYILFRSCLRCDVVSNFEDYKERVSTIYCLFVENEYEEIIFNFLIEDLEQIQIFIANKLYNANSYNYLMSSCQKLQNDLDQYKEVFGDSEYFTRVIKLENTINTLSQNLNDKYSIDIPKMICVEHTEEVISVNRIAIFILNLAKSDKSKLLLEVVSGFKEEISWREFYFLCKVFAISDEVYALSEDTIFNNIKSKFLKIEEKYREYTDTYIKEEKERILNYQGSKKKKYILLLSTSDIDKMKALIKSLSLDFIVKGNNVYINYIYFNGFKNLEKNFGKYLSF